MLMPYSIMRLVVALKMFDIMPLCFSDSVSVVSKASYDQRDPSYVNC
uniref:Uncharacterized protein n=1 Tax=Arundo donax TaxID=35708 RepID=A0A0A9DTN9_ARUDO